VDPRQQPPAPALALPKPRRSPGAALLSFLLHVAIVLLVLAPWGRELVEALSLGRLNAAAGGGGGGGNREAYISLPANKPPAAAVTPAPAVTTTPPVVEPAPVPEPVAAPTPDTQVVASGANQGNDTVPGSGPGAGGGTGGGTGGGNGPGTGTGTGPGNGGGEGGQARPPELRQLIALPADRPKDLRGTSVRVTFWVDSDGKVNRVNLEPEIHDRGFSNRLLEVMRNYRFRPARGPDGSAVPGTYTITLLL
jgi:TonB family protein